MKTVVTLIILTFAMFSGEGVIAQSQEKQKDPEYFSGKVKLRVDGIACPFCSLGLEKKLKKIEGVESVEINVEEAFAVLTLGKDKKVTREEVFNEVRKAGFTPVQLTKIKE